MHNRLIGDYDAQYAVAAYFLYDKAGTLASIIYVNIKRLTIVLLYTVIVKNAHACCSCAV